MGAMNKRGVRHGCMLGMFLFCITMAPVYASLRTVIGDEGVLYTYCDDAYILAPAEEMAAALQHAPGIFGKVGLRLGYGP